MKKQRYFVTLDGVERSLTEWAHLTSTKYSTLLDRYQKKWPPEEIIYGRDGDRFIQIPPKEDRDRIQAEIRLEKDAAELQRVGKTTPSMGNIRVCRTYGRELDQMGSYE